MVRPLQERDKDSERLTRLAGWLLIVALMAASASTVIMVGDLAFGVGLWPAWVLGYIAAVGFGYSGYRAAQAGAHVPE